MGSRENSGRLHKIVLVPLAKCVPLMLYRFKMFVTKNLRVTIDAHFSYRKMQNAANTVARLQIAIRRLRHTCGDTQTILYSSVRYG